MPPFVKNLFAGLFLLCGFALAAQEPEIEGIKFPMTMAGLTRGDVTKYKEKELGSSVKYGGPTGTADVYVYGMGIKNIPDGAVDGAVKEHLALVVNDVFRMEKAGHYENVRKIHEKTVFFNNAGGAKTGFYTVCLAFSYKKNRTQMASYVYLTGYRHNFLKVRYTFPLEAKSEAEPAMENFVAEIARQMK